MRPHGYREVSAVSLLNTNTHRVSYVFPLPSVACLGKAAARHFDRSSLNEYATVAFLLSG
jgi:hypothetical protein